MSDDDGDQQEAQRAYGSPGVGGGTPVSVRSHPGRLGSPQDDSQFLDDFASRYNMGSLPEAKKISQAEIARFLRIRLGRQVCESLVKQGGGKMQLSHDQLPWLRE